MDYVQFLTLLATMIAGFGFVYREFKLAQSDLKSDLRNYENEIRNDIRTQSNRSDQLYTMFIDLLKSQKQRTDP